MYFDVFKKFSFIIDTGSCTYMVHIGKCICIISINIVWMKPIMIRTFIKSIKAITICFPKNFSGYTWIWIISTTIHCRIFMLSKRIISRHRYILNRCHYRLKGGIKKVISILILVFTVFKNCTKIISRAISSCNNCCIPHICTIRIDWNNRS